MLADGYHVAKHSHSHAPMETSTPPRSHYAGGRLRSESGSEAYRSADYLNTRAGALPVPVETLREEFKRLSGALEHSAGWSFGAGPSASASASQRDGTSAQLRHMRLSLSRMQKKLDRVGSERERLAAGLSLPRARTRPFIP